MKRYYVAMPDETTGHFFGADELGKPAAVSSSIRGLREKVDAVYGGSCSVPRSAYRVLIVEFVGELPHRITVESGS